MQKIGIGYLVQNRAHYMNELWYQMSRKYYTLCMKVWAWWWDINLGKNTKFQGFSHFKRLQNGKISIGSGCYFLSKKTSNKAGLYCPCMLYTTKGAVIKIGDNCGFSGTRIWASTSVVLGNNVRCGANTLIMDTDAHTDDYRAGKDAPIIIEDNVWLGMNVTVLKGVCIGENSLNGAGSIVTRDIPANVVAAGIPCRVVKSIN